ncbi:NADPH-dependent F420 reductase [Rhodococcoides yunnanense]|uniref:NADPH-dependent F420 reductase n=1 Tax=Rhodococcoides yunnanense TaxID=278209 RepID=UPI000934FF7D|nr:NAD(P)-binding domain-containing protein [Rhodococcus yunnanensis]
MTTISIIGSGNMATAIGTRAIRHGHTVEILSRDSAKAQALAERIGDGATVGTYGHAPAGDIVIVAVPYSNVVAAVKNYGEPLAGRILVDISNTFNADASSLATAPGSSATKEIAAVAPEGTQVVKALNTIFGHVLTRGTSLDAFLAGDNADAKERVAEFLTSMNLRPRDTGGLRMASVLESAGLLLMGLAQNGAGFDLALGAADVL